MLLAMAASEERAGRIRELKDSRPDLTWERIAVYCDVRERSAIEWSRSGGISHENCMKLATLFDVEGEWLWSGRDVPSGTGDLIGALSVVEKSQADRIESKLDELLAAAAEKPLASVPVGLTDAIAHAKARGLTNDQIRIAAETLVQGLLEAARAAQQEPEEATEETA